MSYRSISETSNFSDFMSNLSDDSFEDIAPSGILLGPKRELPSPVLTSTSSLDESGYNPTNAPHILPVSLPGRSRRSSAASAVSISTDEDSPSRDEDPRLPWPPLHLEGLAYLQKQYAEWIRAAPIEDVLSVVPVLGRNLQSNKQAVVKHVKIQEQTSLAPVPAYVVLVGRAVGITTNAEEFSRAMKFSSAVGFKQATELDARLTFTFFTLHGLTVAESLIDETLRLYETPSPPWGPWCSEYPANAFFGQIFPARVHPIPSMPFRPLSAPSVRQRRLPVSSRKPVQTSVDSSPRKSPPKHARTRGKTGPVHLATSATHPDVFDSLPTGPSRGGINFRQSLMGGDNLPQPVKRYGYQYPPDFLFQDSDGQKSDIYGFPYPAPSNHDVAWLSAWNKANGVEGRALCAERIAILQQDDDLLRAARYLAQRAVVEMRSHNIFQASPPEPVQQTEDLACRSSSPSKATAFKHSPDGGSPSPSKWKPASSSTTQSPLSTAAPHNVPPPSLEPLTMTAATASRSQIKTDRVPSDNSRRIWAVFEDGDPGLYINAQSLRYHYHGSGTVDLTADSTHRGSLRRLDHLFPFLLDLYQKEKAGEVELDHASGKIIFHSA